MILINSWEGLGSVSSSIQTSSRAEPFYMNMRLVYMKMNPGEVLPKGMYRDERPDPTLSVFQTAKKR